MTKHRLLSSFLAVMLALTAMAITVPAMAGRVDDFPTFTGYSAKSVYTHDLNDGSLKISWKTNYATSFYVKAILLNEKPISDDYQGQRALKTIYEKDNVTSKSLSLTVSNLLSAADGQDIMYVKIAVGAHYDGHTYWSWIGFRLLPPDDFPDFDSPYSTAKYVYDYNLSNGTLTLSWDTWSDSFRVKAILLNEVPKSDDNQANKAVKVLADKTQSSYKISFTKSQLTSANAQYLKVAVGSQLLGHTYWSWIGFKLIGDEPVPIVASAPVFSGYTAKTITEYNINNGALTINWTAKNATQYLVRAILMDEEPRFDDSANQQTPIADHGVLYGTNSGGSEIWKTTSLPFGTDDLSRAPYLKVAVGALGEGETADAAHAHWTVIGLKLTSAHKYTLFGVGIDYAPGDYFTVDGKPGSASVNISGAIECWGFANYIENTCFGGLGTKYTDIAVPAGQLTPSVLKNLITSAGIGAHVRTNETGHSFIVTSISNAGFGIIQCNGHNNNEYSKWTANRIGTYYYTWEDYVNDDYGSRGIEWIRTHDGRPVKSDSTPIPDPDPGAREAYIYNFLTNTMGMNRAAACGVLVNIQMESGYNPKISGDNGTAYGICQWRLDRLSNLKTFCANNGYDYTSLIGQLYFMQNELSYYRSGSVLSKLQSVANTAQGAYDAGYYWCYNYEIPANYANVSVARGNKAKELFGPDEDITEIHTQPGDVTIINEPDNEPEPGSAQLTATASPMQADGTFTVTLRISNNPGFGYMSLSFNDSARQVTLKSCVALEQAEGAGLSIEGNSIGIQRSSNIVGDGNIIRFSFVSQDKKETTLNFTVSQCWNLDENMISVSNTSVLVKEPVTRIPGDVTGDGAVDGRDSLRLLRYTINPSVEIVKENADVTGDGEIDGRDSLRLLRHTINPSVVLQ